LVLYEGRAVKVRAHLGVLLVGFAMSGGCFVDNPNDTRTSMGGTTTATTVDSESTTQAPTDGTSESTDATTQVATTSGSTGPTTDVETSETDTGPATGEPTETESASDSDPTTGNLPDDDMDGIPNDDDPFPGDGDLPGIAPPFKIHAHTPSVLYTMEVEEPYAIEEVGAFSFDQSEGSVTDIAIDRWGVLYAITFNDLFVCHPSEADCYYLGDLPDDSANGLTLVPPGVLEQDDDTLIAIAESGAWYRVDVVGQQAMFTQIGQYSMGYESSGDAYSIAGVGTYGAVNGPGVSDLIVEVDPSSGTVLATIAQTDGFSSIYGLAGWEDAIFAFDASGSVLKIDPEAGEVEVLGEVEVSWWGAGVSTVLP